MKTAVDQNEKSGREQRGDTLRRDDGRGEDAKVQGWTP